MPADLLQVFSICCASLTLLIVGMAFHTGTIRGFIEKRFSNPEDESMGKGNTEGEDGPKTQRWIRAHRNALENFLPFFVVGLLFSFKVQSSVFWAGCFIAFTVFRFLHAVAYINSKQPFRTLSFFAGWVVIVMISVRLISISI